MLNLSKILLFCIFFHPIIGNSQVYKWIDKNGKIHYSDKPPLDFSINVDELNGLDGKKDKSVDGKVRDIIISLTLPSTDLSFFPSSPFSSSTFIEKSSGGLSE